eukprot:366251-Chlamydomonas_euryale.AAC.9
MQQHRLGSQGKRPATALWDRVRQCWRPGRCSSERPGMQAATIQRGLACLWTTDVPSEHLRMLPQAARCIQRRAHPCWRRRRCGCLGWA